MSRANGLPNKSIAVAVAGTKMHGTKIITHVFGSAMVLFVMQPTSPSIFGIVPLQVAIIIGLSLLCISLYTRTILSDLANVSKSIAIGLALVVVAFVANITMDPSYSHVEKLFQFLTGILILIVALVVGRKDENRTNVIKYVIFGSVASSTVALVQLSDLFPSVWRWTVYDSYSYGATGLEYSPVPFGYSIIGITCLCVTTLMTRKMFAIRMFDLDPLVLKGAVTLQIVAVLASQSRSSILAVFIASMAWFISVGLIVRRSRARSKIVWETRPDVVCEARKARIHNSRVISFSIISVVIGLIAFFGMLFGVTLREEGLAALKDARVYDFWRVYFPVVFDSPFGLGDRNVEFDASAMDKEAINREGKLKAPHNLLLTVGVELGYVAFAGAVMFYFGLFSCAIRRAILVARARRYDHMLLVIALLIPNIGIFVHAWFHNASIFYGDMRNWLWVGLLLSVVSRRYVSSR